MERSLVVGVDGSESSIQAVDWAVDMAARHGLPLRLLHMSLWERYEEAVPAFGTGRPRGRLMAEHIAASTAERARRRNRDIQVTAKAIREDAVAALLHEGHEAFALVTGSRGRGGAMGLLLGSVSLAVAAHADCPVIVVRGAERNRHGGFGRIVLGVGKDPEGSEAVPFAFDEAEVAHSEVDAVWAWRCPAIEAVDRSLVPADAAREHEVAARKTLDIALGPLRAQYPRVGVLGRPVHGHARTVLLDAAATADLLVVGAHRRHGRIGLQLGPVNHAVLHHAPCPVAVVPRRAPRHGV